MIDYTIYTYMHSMERPTQEVLLWQLLIALNILVIWHSLQVYNEVGSLQMLGTRLAPHASLPSSGSSQEKQLSDWEADMAINVKSVTQISSLTQSSS